MAEVAILSGSVLLVGYVLPLLCLHALARRWLIYWHGEGAENQQAFYRCHGCRRLVTWKRIRQGGCACGESRKLSPAVLTLVDKVRLLLMPWLVR